jgi:hypothetical protein
MVSIVSLWLPILLSAVAVFFISFIIHMVLGYHKNDFSAIPAEQQVMDDLHKADLQPGDYHFPRPKDMKDMKSPEFVEKMKQGPVGMLTIVKSGAPTMGKELVQWFIYCVIVSIFAAYVTSRASGPMTDYLTVFRFAGVTAFTGYSLALIQNSIWYKRSWAVTIKSMFDGFIYALFTAGIFGWLWPTISI